MKISLAGYMGSGKTSVGKDLAKKLNLVFLDLDELIKIQTAQTINEIFKNQGEIKFRKIEREILLTTLNQESNYVLALGGGTPAYYDNMKQINEHTFSVYLRLSPMELTQRLYNERESRPLISHLKKEDFPEFIGKHLFERRNFYEQAQFTIDVKSKTTKEIVSEIILQLP